MVRAQIFPFTRSKSTFPWVSICAQRCLVLKNLRHSFWPRTMFLATHKLIFTARKHESCSLLVENLLSQFLMYFCRWLIVNKLLCYVIRLVKTTRSGGHFRWRKHREATEHSFTNVDNMALMTSRGWWRHVADNDQLRCNLFSCSLSSASLGRWKKDPGYDWSCDHLWHKLFYEGRVNE